MFGIDSSELLVIGLVALVVIGPKDLPRVMRMIGQWVAKGRAMSRHLRSGFDTMMREAELEEMQKAWAAQNEAIMKATIIPDPLANSYVQPDPVMLAAAEPQVAPWPQRGDAAQADDAAKPMTARRPRKAKADTAAAIPKPARKRTARPRVAAPES